jgi:GLPGLI family protein
MKKLFFLLSFVLCSVAVAQVKREGTIVYEMKRDLHASMTGENEKYKAMVPQFMTAKLDLFFSPKESLFKYNEDEEEDENENPMGARMRMMRPNLEIHLNNTDKIRTELRGAMGKDYLIESEITSRGWKLSDETSKVAGYDCKKATCLDKEGKPVIAWYAEGIPVSTGPSGYNGLPGVILKLELEEGIMVYEAKKIILEKNKEGVIVKPTKGKKVTKEEFDEEMKKMMPQGGKGLKIMKGD